MADQRVNPSGAGRVGVSALDDRDARRWDGFVFAHRQGTFFHRLGWRNIFRDVFRLEPHYLAANRDAEIAGVLPLVL